MVNILPTVHVERKGIKVSVAALEGSAGEELYCINIDTMVAQNMFSHARVLGRATEPRKHSTCLEARITPYSPERIRSYITSPDAGKRDQLS